MKIEVTEYNILAGKRSSFCGCPIALAINRATGGKYAAHVSPNWINLLNTQTDLWELDCSLPEEAKVFVRGFDNSEKMQPFSFEIPL